MFPVTDQSIIIATSQQIEHIIKVILLISI